MKLKIYSLLTPRHLGGFGDFRKKTAVFGCLTNALAPPPIALESYSTAQNGSASLVDGTRKKFFAWGVRVFL